MTTDLKALLKQLPPGPWSWTEQNAGNIYRLVDANGKVVMYAADPATGEDRETCSIAIDPELLQLLSKIAEAAR